MSVFQASLAFNALSAGITQIYNQKVQKRVKKTRSSCDRYSVRLILLSLREPPGNIIIAGKDDGRSMC